MPDVADESGASRFNVLSRGAAARFLGIARVDGDADATFSRRKLAEILGLSPQPPRRQSRRSAIRAINLAHNIHGPRDLAFAAGLLTWLAPAWQVPTRYRLEIERDGQAPRSAEVGSLRHLAHEQPEEERRYADPDYDAGVVAARYRVCAVSQAGDALCASLIAAGSAAWDFAAVQPAVTRGVAAGSAAWDFAAVQPAVTRGVAAGSAAWDFAAVQPAVTRGSGVTLDVSITGPASRTTGQSAVYSASVGGTATGAISYQWQRRQGTGAWSNVGTSSSYSQSQSSAGTWQVRVTVTRQGVSDTSNVVSTTWAAAPPAPTVDVSITGPASRTTGQSAVYSASVGGTATGAISYQWQRRQGTGAWSNVGTSSSYSQSQSSAGTWQVRVTVTRQGVSDTSNVVSTTWAAPTLTVSIDNPISTLAENATHDFNASVGGTATGATTYAWNVASGGGAIDASGRYSAPPVSSNTQVSVTVTASRQGVSATDSVTFTVTPVVPPLSVSASASGTFVIIHTDPFTSEPARVTVAATAAGGSGGYTYTGAGTYVYTIPSTYSVTVTARDSAGNTASDTVTFEITERNDF